VARSVYIGDFQALRNMVEGNPSVGDAANREFFTASIAAINLDRAANKPTFAAGDAANKIHPRAAWLAELHVQQ
jgi:hypothetical protein